MSIEIVQVDDQLSFGAACRGDVMTSSDLEDLLARLDDSLLDILTKSSDPVATSSPTLDGFPLSLKPAEGSSFTDSGGDLEGGSVPLSPNQRTVQEVFSSISKIPLEKIGIRTPLHALGLDSIAAIQIAARCRRQGVYVTVADVFSGSTIQGICDRLESRQVIKPTPSRESRLSSDVEAQALAVLNAKREEVDSVFPVLPV
jgi:aryl carrier-like protein